MYKELVCFEVPAVWARMSVYLHVYKVGSLPVCTSIAVAGGGFSGLHCRQHAARLTWCRMFCCKKTVQFFVTYARE
jgi:hypothetical protein